MTDQELRQLVRDAIERHLGASIGVTQGVTQGDTSRPAAASGMLAHPSHGLLPLLRSGDSDGACLIEPTVRCNHCGYCLSYGH